MAFPSFPSSSSRSKVTNNFKSLNEFAIDSYDGKVSRSFNPLRLPGTLGALPMDIMWIILDEILMGDGPLTHSALCTIRKLSYATNKAVSAQMSYYLRTNKSLKYLSERLNEVRWHPWRDTIWGPMPLDDSRSPHIEPLPIKEDVDSKSSLLTEVICDDCPACFEWVIKRIHGLECSGCNENGWNFVSLAIQAGSLSMLKYFFIKQPETLPLLWSFSNYLSPTIDRPINILIHGKKVQFIAQLLDFLEPRLTKINCPEAFRNGFAETSELNAFTDELLKYRSSLCSFASPSMAESLKRIGVDLCAFEDAYHAAISNGRDFLDYLHENSTLPKNAEHWFNGKTPFEYAVEKNCLESVRWLKRHGGDNIGQIARDTLLNKVASQLTDDSEVMLQELLFAAQRVMLDHFESARLVRAIVRGLVPFVNARENKRDAGYLKEDKFTSSWKRMQEDRAIRNCALVLKVSRKTFAMGGSPFAQDIVRPSTGFTTDLAVAIQRFTSASNTAELAGLYRLASTINRLFI